MSETNNQLLKAIRDGSGGGGGNTTASNGLTKTGDDIKLGGTVTADTTVVTGETITSISNVPFDEFGTNPYAGFLIVGGETVQFLAANGGATVSNGFAVTYNDTQLFLFSPNGTKYQVVVDNAGALSTLPG